MINHSVKETRQRKEQEDVRVCVSMYVCWGEGAGQNVKKRGEG